MHRSEMRRAEPVRMRPDDVLDIRRQIQNLEFQVQQLRQNIDGEVNESAAPATVDSVSYETVRAMIEARRSRDDFFESYLFGEPAWDILLELYASELGHMRMPVSNACLGAAVPATTALRWIGNLEEAGLLQRHNDPLDGRRVFLTLTDKARESFRAYFDAVPLK